MKEGLIQRVEILLQQLRYNEASEILSDLYHEHPNDIEIILLYCEVSLSLNSIEKAADLIGIAISLDADNDYAYYVKARVLLNQDKLDDAENFLSKAIELNPYESNYFALLARINLNRKKYTTALELSDHALELNPENVLALNTRSTSLLKLNRKKESASAMEDALSEDPNNAFTHATTGWNLLETGDHKKALTHFQESLKNDPNFEFAQEGMKEALKAEYVIYKLFLKFSFWISNLTEKYQWLFLIGYYFSFKFISRIARNNESLQIVLYPLLALMFIFAISTWLIQPITNLFFRFNKYGKHLLSSKEKLSSNFVAFSGLVFLFGLASYLVYWSNISLALSIFGFTMMIPFSVMFVETKIKNILTYYSIAMFLLGALALYQVYATNILVNQLATFYLFGFIAYQWIANFVIIREENK